jgi:hypothetical protein
VIDNQCDGGSGTDVLWSACASTVNLNP